MNDGGREVGHRNNCHLDVPSLRVWCVAMLRYTAAVKILVNKDIHDYES